MPILPRFASKGRADGHMVKHSIRPLHIPWILNWNGLAILQLRHLSTALRLTVLCSGGSVGLFSPTNNSRWIGGLSPGFSFRGFMWISPGDNPAPGEESIRSKFEHPFPVH